MVLENWVRGKLHELLGHYVEIDRDALKIGKRRLAMHPLNRGVSPGSLLSAQVFGAGT